MIESEKQLYRCPNESMKSITVWDVALLLEAIVYIVFAALVALEYCTTSYNMYLNPVYVWFIYSDTSLGSEVRKTIYLFVFLGSLFRILAFVYSVPI